MAKRKNVGAHLLRLSFRDYILYSDENRERANNNTLAKSIIRVAEEIRREEDYYFKI